MRRTTKKPLLTDAMRKKRIAFGKNTDIEHQTSGNRSCFRMKACSAWSGELQKRSAAHRGVIATTPSLRSTP